ncbi:autotransporter assembly complex protein TamA [Roseovarius salinarum]|uniref:autotransporter assembly complex protein TamA n=1 Tax=Roseovarius salinarum TaxID=1981892 RepID=UPI000C333C58|nr:BamA/TamA family outer membrane protein [Roseovarius salinarum]
MYLAGHLIRTSVVAVALAVLTTVAPLGAAEVTLLAPAAGDSLRQALRASSRTITAAGRETASAQDLLAAARADYARLVNTLYDAGFYGGVVNIRVDGREVAEIPPLGGPERIGRITIEVKAGTPFTFSTARIRPRAPETELPEAFAPGRRADATVIRDATRAGIDGWRAHGHAKADVASQRITADHSNDSLAAEIMLAPGPRLSFGTLTVEGDSRVRPERIREIAGLPTGEVYSPEQMRRAAERLRRTGVFSSVVLTEAETPTADARLGVTAEVSDAKPRRIGFGGELASREGLAVSGFWLHRNLLGGAERVRVEGEIGGIGGDSGGTDYSLSARISRPATFSPDTGVFAEARLEERDEPDYRDRSFQVEGGLSRIFSERLSGEAAVAYRFSDIDDALGSRSLGHLLLPAEITRDTRDSPLDAAAGNFLEVSATPFAAVGDGDSGARLHLDARVYRGLGQDGGTVLAARAQAGTVLGAGLAGVPPEMLFFSGGAGTVRGQPYQSLGVDLGGGRQTGGRSFLAVSLETRLPLQGGFGAVAFADTGFVGRDSWGGGNGEWHSGAGLGLRYDTGVGPIRLDVATPLDGDAGEDFELYVGIGQAF